MKSKLLLLILLLNALSFAQNHFRTVEFTKATDEDSLILPMVGVISGPISLPGSVGPDISEQLKDIGVNSIRNNDYYNDALDIAGIFCCSDTGKYPSWNCDPYDESNYHWELSDSLFQIFMDNGFEPFFRLGDEYGSHLRHHDFAGPQNALQERNWIIAAIKTVERYQHWGGREKTFEYIDIMTEWPNSVFWDRSNKEFIDFWTKAFDSLKTHFPQYKIGGPGFLGPTIEMVIKGEHGNNAAVSFLTSLYEHNLRPDWIGWHLWYNNPYYYYLAAKLYRDMLDGVGDFSFVPWAGTGFFKDVEIICDAFGVSALEDNGEHELPRPEQDRLMNKKEGASMLTADWIAMQYADVKRVYYYRANEPNSRPDAGPQDKDMGTTGLFFGDSVATYKPKAHAFRLWSRIANEYPYMLKTDLPSLSADSTTLWLLAGKDDEGNYGVLVANIEDVDVRFSLVLEGTPVTKENFSDVKIYQIDNTNDGRTPINWNGNDFMIEKGCVQFITLTPSPSAVESAGTKPTEFTLFNNYPNPVFENSENGGGTIIKYSLPSYNLTGDKIASSAKTVQNVTLKVFDVLGREVATLVNEPQSSGIYSVEFDTSNLPAGIYFYRLQAGRLTATKKMIVVK